MSSSAHRRRAKSLVTTIQAFEENKSSTQEISNEDELLFKNSRLSNGHIDLDRSYERAYFTMNGLTVEVILNNDILSWSTVSDEISHEEIHERKSTKKKNMNSINLHNVYAVSPIYNRWNWYLNNNNEEQTNIIVSSSIDSQLRGFQLHSYERMDENILQEILIIFQSDLPHQIERWYQSLSKIIAEYKPSRNILVICNPYAGSRYNRHTYNIKIKPMLERAQYNIHYLEINDLYSADKVFNDFQGDFNSLYGIVIIGGDGSVINVINALLRYLAKENRIELDAENGLPPIPFSICIVPNGTTNIICHSIHGNTDYYTPILHLLFNHRMKIDMSAIFDINYNFVTANFSTGAGYPANALKYFSRYSLSKPKQIIEKSFAKAASNKNLKSIEMEIRYIPADQNTVHGSRCYQGCPYCIPAAIEQTADQVKVFDDAHIRKISKRKKSLLSNNGHSSSRKISVEKNWKILRHNYLQVAVLTNASLWSFAPQGLSKFGHLADGLLDLILIEQTTRKDFLRYLKRNGNSKNQYGFPFTDLIKVKEIEIELKLPKDNLINEISNIDSSLSDDSSNEEHSNNETKLSSIEKHQPHPPSVPILEDNRRSRRHDQHFNNQYQQQKHSENESDSKKIDSYNSNIPHYRKNSFQLLRIKKDKIPLPRPSSSCWEEHINENQYQTNRPVTAEPRGSTKSFLNLLRRGNSSSRKHDSSFATTNNNSRSKPLMINRSSTIENEKTSTSVNNPYRHKKQPCMWNLDFTPYNSSLIRIKCFHRFLPIFGVGINPDTMMTEVNYSCFGRIG